MASSMTNCTTAERYRHAVSLIDGNIALLEEVDPSNWELPRLRALRAEWLAKIARYS